MNIGEININFLEGDKIFLFKELRKNGYPLDKAHEKSQIPVTLSFSVSNVKDINKVLDFLSIFQGQRDFVVETNISYRFDNRNMLLGTYAVYEDDTNEYIFYQKEYENGTSSKN